MIEEVVVSRENIRLKAEAKDWKEAIKISGNILKDNEYVKEQYVEDMVDAVEKLGPYIVIMPHVAIAHARPGEDVLKDGLSLATFKKPIEFGNEDNDPVDLVFSLCAKSNQNHLKVLEYLAKVLEDEKKVYILRSSGNIDEVYNILNNN